MNNMNNNSRCKWGGRVDIDKWYTRAALEIMEYWKTDGVEGLASSEVKNRLQKFGYNEMVEKKKPAWWEGLIAQFQDFMVLVLLAATLISAFLGEYTDAVTILMIVIVNAILGFVQEYRAEQSMAALKKMVAPTARVIRNGILQQIPARELVPGDVLSLETGDKIAADARIIEVQNLEAEEAALTGESLPVRKVVDKEYPENIPLGDRKNMVYAGTSIIKGRGKAIVCATGMATEVGHIADMIQEKDQESTPLEQRLESLGRLLVWGCLGICLLVVLTGVMKGEPLFLMCMAGISLAVAAIPEGLPAIVTVALALGVQRMIRRNAIIRKLPAVETLGCTTVICSDKTGTLTQNAMTVGKIFTGEKLYEVTGNGYDIKGNFLLNKQEFEAKRDNSLQQCLEISILCNNSILKHHNVGIAGLWRNVSKTGWSIEGDPTEGALVVAAAKANIWRSEIEKTQKRLAEIPFESERRRMSVVYEKNSKYLLYVKGAPDVILDLCQSYSSKNKDSILTSKMKADILAVNDELTQEAFRVLAVAYRQIGKSEAENPGEELEKDLVFAGLIGMMDPPRQEVKPAISLCRQAGIKTVMITGDHPNTAVAIAKELQMFHNDSSQALTGAELDGISDIELAKVINHITVYSRVSPAHKLRIVRALKAQGHIVAMTGDGVNDAPAIKEADIGIAMGMNGTDVTKEAAAMVLADDNFATIVAAVEEGRGIYDNIRKFIRYLLSCNLGEVLTMFIASIVGLPLPLLPVQILWVNLVTDGLPAMALGVDPNDRTIMNRQPRNPRESVFSRGLTYKIITRGFQIGLSTVLVFAAIYYLKNDLPLARTMAFCTLVFTQMFHVFDCRSEVDSIFKIGFFKNKYLVAATSCSIFMQLLVVYHPFMRETFATVPLDVMDWLIILCISGWTFLIGAGKHIFVRRQVTRSVAGRVH